ncbi:MAG: hypothetical protein ACK56F_18805, partial [bacterium]
PNLLFMEITLYAFETGLRIIIPLFNLQSAIPGIYYYAVFYAVDLVAEHFEAATFLAVLNCLNSVLVLEIVNLFFRYVTF